MLHHRSLSVAISILLISCGLVFAQGKNDSAAIAPDETISYKTVALPNGKTDDLKLHLFKPQGHQASDEAPCIVFFFGGGWTGGTPTQFYPQCKYLADRGMVAISAEYRTKKSHQVEPKACVFDGKSAIRWVRRNAAELGIDPNRIAAGGGSAGGQVAAAVAACQHLEEPDADATVRCRPDALVLFNPVYDNGPNGYGHARVKAYWETFSPMHCLHADMPPTIGFFGSQDTLIPVATTKAFQKRMDALGVRCDNHLYEGAGHGFFNSSHFRKKPTGPPPGNADADGKPDSIDYFAETMRETERFLLSVGMLDGNWSSPDFWEATAGKTVTDGWSFTDGEVRLEHPGRTRSIFTQPLPSNFELSFEWKIVSGTNSGLKYRVRKHGGQMWGLEYQIIDEPADKSTAHTTGAIYDLQASSKEKKVHPPGDWNQSRIVAIGHRIEHYLNGTLVASTTTSGPDWDSLFFKSKFLEFKDFAKPDGSSRIMLTDHGGKSSYRNFRFTAREPVDEELPVATAPFFANGIRNGWADQNSIVIWTRTSARSEMRLDGPEFLDVDQKELLRSENPAKLLAAQLPPGVTLNQMQGACPGAPGQVRLTYIPVGKHNARKTTDWIKTSADYDFTAQWKLNKLRADSKYSVVIEARAPDSDQISSVIRGSFRTAPAVDQSAPITFCVTTCHDFLRRDNGNRGHKIYPSMSAFDPDFVVHAGDIEYYDKAKPYACTTKLMRFKWARIFSLPDNREFYLNHTSYFLKDDHDTLKNDCWPGTKYGSVSFEEGVKLFNDEQFPSHSPRYKTVQWGRDLQIWILEGRDFRSAHTMPDGPEKTILGVEQKAWLKKTLSESTAAFKIVISPTPIVGPDRKNKKDNHANDIFEHEGNELRAEFSKHDGLVVICGDRHWQYASVDETSGLWEFGCGPGSEKHQMGWKAGDTRPEHRFLRVDGGYLTGEVSYDDANKEDAKDDDVKGDVGKNDGGTDDEGQKKSARLTLRHHAVSGEAVSEFVFPVPDELKKD